MKSVGHPAFSISSITTTFRIVSSAIRPAFRLVREAQRADNRYWKRVDEKKKFDAAQARPSDQQESSPELSSSAQQSNPPPPRNPLLLSYSQTRQFFFLPFL